MTKDFLLGTITVVIIVAVLYVPLAIDFGAY